MSSFDDIFSGQGGGSNWNEKPFDKEAWAAKKQEARQELYVLPPLSCPLQAPQASIIATELLRKI